MRAWTSSGFALALCFGFGCASPAAQAPSHAPNIVLIVTDDQGWADVGCYGASGLDTPNLDRLAREGVKFTDFYVSQPVCSASRASILTGCYPNRIGIGGALGPASTRGLSAQETTLAELCRERGYATAIFGKWHLGHLPEFLPTRHGFDRFRGIPYSNDMGPGHATNPAAWGDLPLLEGERTVELNPDQARFTSEFSADSVQFIRESAAAKQPFFVYLAQPMPHVPLAVAPQYRGRSARGLYGDVIEELDAGVGAILHTLDELSLERETLVIFTSDNGPWLPYGNHAGSAGPLREGKGTTFEGGVRVPFLARWPGRIPAGTVRSEPAMTIDLLPTIAGYIGSPLPELTIDGRVLAGLLESRVGAEAPHDALYFWYEDNQLQAVRSGRWKLHFPHSYRDMVGVTPGSAGLPVSYPMSRTGLELYDLESDVGEQVNVAVQHPDVLARLSALADGMRSRLGDSLLGVRGTEQRPPGGR